MGHRSIRIVSDGHGSTTRVYLEDGTELQPVSATMWLEAREANRVDLTFMLPTFDAHADLEETVLTCPVCSGAFSHHCPDPRLDK